MNFPEDPQFCAGCKILLKKKSLIASIFSASPKIYKFEDGNFCERCARDKVKSSGRSMNKSNSHFSDSHKNKKKGKKR